MGFLSDLFGGGDSNSSASTSSTTSNQTDRRIANDSGLVLQGDGNAFDTSTYWQNNDSSNRSTTQDFSTAWQNNDSSNRSLTNSGNSTTTNTITDGGIAKDAFATVTASQKVVGASFSDLLTGATKIFTTQSNNQKDSFADLLGANTTNNNAALAAGSSGLKSAYEGFGALVTSANKVLEGNARSTENLGKTVAAAYQTATAEKAGGFDNKTIVILAVVAGAAFYFAKR